MKKNGERCIFSKFPWKMHVNRQFFDRESPVKGCVCFMTGDGELYSVKPETTEEFFQKEILGRLNA